MAGLLSRGASAFPENALHTSLPDDARRPGSCRTFSERSVLLSSHSGGHEKAGR